MSTAEAWIRISVPAIEIGEKHSDSAGSPTTNNIPAGRTHGNAASYAALAAEVTSTAWAPPLFRKSRGTSVEVAFKVRAAPESFRVFEFFVRDVDRGYLGAQADSNLHRQMAQAADTKNGQALARLQMRFFQRAIDGDSGAKERRRFDR